MNTKYYKFTDPGTILHYAVDRNLREDAKRKIDEFIARFGTTKFFTSENFGQISLEGLAEVPEKFHDLWKTSKKDPRMFTPNTRTSAGKKLRKEMNSFRIPNCANTERGLGLGPVFDGFYMGFHNFVGDKKAVYGGVTYIGDAPKFSKGVIFKEITLTQFDNQLKRRSEYV